MRLTKQEIAWIANEFQSNRTVQEIAIDTGMSKQNVKRALAEAGLVNLSWYKTNEENKMLTFLKAKGINNTEQLLTQFN